MSLQTLIDDLKSILKRDDCTDDEAALHIRHGIERMQNEIRIPPMERIANVTIDGTTDTIAIPSDLLQIIDVFVEDGNSDRPRALDKVSLRQLVQVSASEVPSVYARVRATLKIAGSLGEGAVVTIHYYGKFTTLATYADDNEVTQDIPLLATYAGLSFAGDAFRHDSKGEWEQRYLNLSGALMSAAVDLEMSGGPSSVQPLYTEPL